MKTYDLSVRWRCFPLHPNTPQEGQLLEELFNTSSERVTIMIQQLEATAMGLGLPFGKRTKTYNSRLAQELGLWAEDQGRGEKFHMGAFKSYFADGLNIAEHSVLLDLAQQSGLDRDEAQQIVKKRSYREKVDADWNHSKELGITAVPTMVMGNHKLVGNQKYEILQQLVAINKVGKR